jgi:hypothetical protein
MKITLMALLAFWGGLALAGVDIQPAAKILNSRCLDCHDAETRKGGINLTKLLAADNLNEPKTAALWEKVDQVIHAGEMPPKKKKPLTAPEKTQLAKWYKLTYVLKNGKEHIGQTALRRLSRYELINTLEDLLHLSLKQPYVFSPEVPALLPSTLETILPPDAPGESGFHNDAAHLAGSKPSILKYSQAFEYALHTFAQDSEARGKVFGFKEEPVNLADATANKILQRFMKRAWRGYRNADNEQVVWRTYQAQRKSKAPVPSLLHAMKIVLLSPAFVYRIETAKDRGTPYRVSAYELASRLSYFLWASMPDDELFTLAESGELLEESLLSVQIDRLLNSPKRLSLAEDFAGQWLGFSEIVSNRVFYRNENWNRGVYDEVLFFFDELIKSDRSILDIIDSDWLYQSNYTGVRTGGSVHSFPLKHQDIFKWRRQRPKGIRERFYDPPRLIKIKSDQRGGIITSVGILRTTSAPEKTNPIRRGVWMLDKIIGRPMHSPENVPALSKSEKVDGKRLVDLADILKAHTSKAICISCHKHIDPIGLGLESFDPYGKWRTSYKNKRPIKSIGQFPNGGNFQSPKEMKQILISEYQKPIVKNIVERLFSYAIGRKIQPYDRPAVERICAALEHNKFKMNTLIQEIISSSQFQSRQDSP